MEQVSLDIGDAGKAPGTEDGAPDSLADDEIIDFITGKRVRDRGSEPVRQRVARALFHEYGISVADMERDFPIPVDAVGRRRTTKKADIAIFEHEAEHRPENLRRVVICKPEPKASRKVTKIRTYTQAKEDLEELETLLGTEATPRAQYGMWTNGVDFFFLYKESTRFGARFEQRADWPLADESVQSGTVVSVARLRRGEREMLKTAFQRCHNYIHGNEGMPKDAAFWQFLYLLFAKMYDERISRRTGRAPEFYALPSEPFTEDGRKAIRKRIEALFAEVKREYPLFTARDEITMSDRALAFIVGELAPYDLTGTDIDVKGMAYQELLGANLRGDRGQYFTPIGAVELTVSILDPQEDETVFDPACGTGGFLRETLRHLLNKWRDEEQTSGLPDTEEQLIAHQDRLHTFAEEHLFGADFDPFLVRATSMSIMTLTGGEGNVYHLDSLAFPRGHLSGVAPASERIQLGSVDVLMTNPPFGTDIKVESAEILDMYRDGVASAFIRNKETGRAEPTGERRAAVSPEQLFIQRAVEWVRPGGRIGIVLPNGILSNPGPVDEGIRQWILDNCWVLASVELPVETFIHDAGVNILTSLLFLKRKTEREKLETTMGKQDDYPVFMAVAEKVGIDRRGNPVYKRHPDGEIVLEVVEEKERVRIGDRDEVTILHRKRKAIDDDLKEIAKAYKEFRVRHKEPGLPRGSRR
ncbi:type I restriction enzyme M protein [Actinomadura madurae]|uniref:Type I restriction enzyme M protein n=1 Tax=Actinomadura madurae TaxID=1993 RepID=A0A1I5EX09_9ACTN|nr:type I restriction enzyme M protein [Actinomadura madurae]SPT60111.1 Probable type I restriction enzyme BthVORF4518P M protein [Actinomadura madurae]